jgi:hypothetical protein
MLWPRQRYNFAAGKIAMYLQRYHQVMVSPSGVWRILHRRSESTAAFSAVQGLETRWKRHDKQRPGHQLQVDLNSSSPLSQTGRKMLY